MNKEFSDEGKLIARYLNQNCPKIWDGKKCILELKDIDYQWRQMEWIGFYFEYIAGKILKANIKGEVGPRINNTKFDYKNEYIWDFKAHVLNSTSHPWAILNDIENVTYCIDNLGGIGYIVALGNAEYDNNEEFKQFHDALKGKKSDYEIKRVKRGAPSRRRKTRFDIVDYKIFYFQNDQIIKDAKMGGWIKGFQEGMRNADGSPRRGKLQINVENIPKDILI